jgi:molecular chaperone DnaK (HSP70)
MDILDETSELGTINNKEEKDVLSYSACSFEDDEQISDNQSDTPIEHDEHNPICKTQDAESPKIKVLDAIGIDYGASCLRVAYANDKGAIEFLSDDLGEFSFPAAILLSPEGIFVGVSAKEKMGTFPSGFIENPLRHLGEDDWFFEYNGDKYNCVFITALILKFLKQKAESAMKIKATTAVITVPSYFSDTERTAMSLAAKVAGFSTARLVNQVTAIALAYVHLRETESGKFVFCNLGMGRFEASAINISDRAIKITATKSNKDLNGELYLKLVGDYLKSKFFEEHSFDFDCDADGKANLSSVAERVFFALSDDFSTDVKLRRLIESGFDSDTQVIIDNVFTIRTLRDEIHISQAPFDYYDFLQIPRDSSLDSIKQRISVLKIEKNKLAQDSPINEERYKAGGDLVVLARAKRIFYSEASKDEYDKSVLKYENSFSYSAAMGKNEEDNQAERHFPEREIFDACEEHSYQIKSRVENMLRSFHSEPCAIIEYLTQKEAVTKIILTRDDASRILREISQEIYDCIEDVVKSAGWSMEDISKILFSGGFSQSPIMHRDIEKLLHASNICNVTVEQLPLSYASQGASINANMIVAE